MKDQNILLHLENSIKEKYGEKAITNPKANWTDEKEKDYLEQIKELYKKENNSEYIDNIIESGVSLPKRLIKTKENNICVICKCYSFNRDDDLYLNIYNACFKCYIEKIENREHKWKKN